MAWSAYARRSFSGNAPSTTLTSGIDNAVTTLPVASTAGWPTISAPSTGFVIVVDGGTASEEAMFVTAFVPNTSATVTRGFDGTTAVAHSSPATVQLCDSAVDVDEANQLVHALLTGGTTGQVATADTTLTPPIKWASNPAGIPLSTVTTAGDIIAATGNATVERLAKGTAGQVLTVGGVDASGLEWASPATPGLTKIAESILGVTTGSVTFSSIPGTYRSLLLVCDARADGSASLNLQLNGDTAADYDQQFLSSDNTTAPSTIQQFGLTAWSVGVLASSGNGTANLSSPVEILVPNYSATTFLKNMLARTGYLDHVSSVSELHSYAGLWRSTAAITSIKLFPGAQNFLAGTTLTLYGVTA